VKDTLLHNIENQNLELEKPLTLLDFQQNAPYFLQRLLYCTGETSISSSETLMTARVSAPFFLQRLVYGMGESSVSSSETLLTVRGSSPLFRMREAATSADVSPTISRSDVTNTPFHIQRAKYSSYSSPADATVNPRRNLGAPWFLRLQGLMPAEEIPVPQSPTIESNAAQLEVIALKPRECQSSPFFKQRMECASYESSDALNLKPREIQSSPLFKRRAASSASEPVDYASATAPSNTPFYLQRATYSSYETSATAVSARKNVGAPLFVQRTSSARIIAEETLAAPFI